MATGVRACAQKQALTQGSGLFGGNSGKQEEEVGSGTRQDRASVTWRPVGALTHWEVWGLQGMYLGDISPKKLGG